MDAGAAGGSEDDRRRGAVVYTGLIVAAVAPTREG
jgi:hypothetical protein